MAFVYNNKLPFHSWGVDGSSEGGAGYFLAGSHGSLTVPAAEYGPVPQYRRTAFTNDQLSLLSSYRAFFDASPCDAQMPLCKLVAASDIQYAYALTLHGELYVVPSAALSWVLGTSNQIASTARRIARLTSSKTNKPFVDVCVNTETWRSAGVSYAGIVIDKDGRAFWISSSSFANGAFRQYPELLEISLPNGSSAKHLWNHNGTIVLTTTDNKTYLKTRTGSVWYALTSGCYDVSFPTGWQSYLWDAVPVVTVAGPPSGGTPATIEAYFDQIGARYYLDTIRITNPGSGYTSNAAVTFSIPPSFGPAVPDISLKVFTEWLTQYPSRMPNAYRVSTSPLMISNVGALHEITIAPSLQAAGETFALPWSYKLPVSFTAANQDKFVKDLVASGLTETAYFIDTNNQLYSCVIAKTTNPRVRSAVTDVTLVDSGSWAAIASAEDVMCAVKTDNTMHTWGTNGQPGQLNGVLFADGSNIGAARTVPSQIASGVEWLNVFSWFSGFVAIRKDAICREIGQPMEYFPDWHYETQT